MSSSSPATRWSKALRAVSALLIVAPAVAVASGASAETGPYDPYFAPPATVADLGATSRPFGLAAGDFDGDGAVDLVVGRTTGNVAFAKGAGDGTFAAPVTYAWKQGFFNAWSFAPADVNGDGRLDLVWGANAVSSGCSVPGAGCTIDTTVNDGDVRVWFGNGDGTFAESAYFVSGVSHNAGTLLADVGTDAGSVAAGDIDGDGDPDVVAGAAEGVTVLRNDGGSFSASVLNTSGTYFAPTSTQNSPWGLAFGDADGDGDADLWVGDRALYVYLYANDGAGSFAVTPGNIPGLETRPNVYLRHDSYRAAVGYTPSLASADVNGDGRDDLFVGLHSGTQTPATNVVNDGSVILDVSRNGAHTTSGPLADLGSMARGLQTADVNGDGATDVLGAVYEGQVKVLRQLPPRDTDGDGISDYVDNAPEHANAPRVDMNADGSLNARDQLDNDFDTVLGDPEDPSTWARLGDPADPDDDNDGVADSTDNCVFGANADQSNVDGDQFGDACDPLDDRDEDGDGVPTGPRPGDPLYEEAKAAAAKWSQGDTHFVLRIDALGRFFQNEFTQLMTDAAILTPEQWATKCFENYGPEDGSYEPCGPDPTQAATLPGGKDVPIALVTIPKHLWTDAPVIDWINDRNDDPDLEVSQHGTFHDDVTMRGDWKTLTDRNFFSCETCGLTEAENYERLKIGYDTLLGNYDNKWLSEMGATASSPKIDWSTSAHPMITYAAPYNTSDDTSRKAMAQYGIRSFTASIHEETASPGYGEFFASPGRNDMEAFDAYGMFHASADTQLDPVETPDGTYDADDKAALLAEMQANTQDGGLNTWLIEEVEWSGRTDNEAPREVDPAVGVNREDNTVYLPRWQQWLDLLDYVKAYEGGVVMTLDEVALAKGFDNAPTVANPDQADADSDGVGDVVDDATVEAATATLGRNVEGTLSATLRGGGGNALAGQPVTFAFDSDGDGTAESTTVTTDGDGVATTTVTATRPVGPASFTATWTEAITGQTASDTATVTVTDGSSLSLDAANPATGQVTDEVTVTATLVDSDGEPLAGRAVTFRVGGASATGTTDALGNASATLRLEGPAGAAVLSAEFAGDATYSSSTATAAFTVTHEDSVLRLADAVAERNTAAVARATLTEADGMALAGQQVTFQVEVKDRKATRFETIGTAVTDADGVATLAVPQKYVGGSGTAVKAVYAGDASFLGSSASARAYRG